MMPVTHATPPARDAVAIIPVRMGSTRFPGKALADRTGKTLTQHVWERARAAASVARVIIALDDERIARAVDAFGGEWRMTRLDHPNGTSRIAEVAEHVTADIIVNVQGDEPEIDPALIDLAVETLRTHPECAAATLASPFAAGDDPRDANVVKVVLDRAGRALYFSRSLIPGRRPDTGIAPGAEPLRHVGLYVYRRDFLLRYPALAPAPLEQTESLEQLRLLEHGERIAVAVTEASYAGIDTPEQYEAFVARWRSRE